MDIVLGVSMTPTTVRMVLVEGDKADGRTVDHDVFDITTVEGSANPSASDQVISAILGTQQSASVGGHKLIATGVTWSDHDEASALRDGLAARGIDDVILVSDLHAAGALAQAAGRAVGYDKTALLFVERDTATLSVAETRDGSIVKALTRSLHSTDAMAVMTEMVTSLEAQEVRPGGLFVVGSGVDVTSVKEHLEPLVSLPVNAPEDAEMALARGAALAAASTPRFEATTIGLAYSQDPEGPTAGDAFGLDPAFAVTQVRPVGTVVAESDDADAAPADETRRPFMLVGSTLTSIFVVGVVALVISLAVSIRPTADQRPNPGEAIVVPSQVAPAPQEQPPAAAPAPAPAAVEPPKPPETIPAPVPVAQEAPQPRQVFVEPQRSNPAPAAAPAAPVPAAPVPAPVPVPEAPPVVAPAPAPAYYPPVYNPPIYIPPIIQLPQRPWYPQSPPTYVPDAPTYVPQQPPTYVPQQPSWDPPRQSPRSDDDLPSVLSPRQPSRQVPQQQAPSIQIPLLPSGPSRGGGGSRNPFWPF